ncbi:MAG TPA: hypothetical protein PKE30_05535 [Niabella sp.]|nr:hypothetical protein [Niabella sp.]
MTSINHRSLQVFNHLIKQLAHKEYIRFAATGIAPLSFECIGELYCMYGHAKKYSLMQTFTQNGELMLHPEICFFHFVTNGQNDLTGVYAYYYRLDLLGICQQSISISNKGDLEVQVCLQRQHTSFADNWLWNINEQGFLNNKIKD